MDFNRLILHDAFAFPGGGERLVKTLAQAFQAVIYTGQINERNLPRDYFQQDYPVSLQAYANSPFWLQFSKTLQLWRAFAKFPKCSANLAIFSGALSPLAHRRIRGKKILYCHTPPRMLYDQKKLYLNQTSVFKKPFTKILMHKYRQAYEKAITDMDLVIANSHNVQKRISHYLGRDSVVVHPPCDTSQYYCNPEQGYYLSTARLDPLKRVERIVQAFLQMPDKRLIVVSGGPEEQKIKRLAQEASNIEIRSWVSDEKLKELLANCIASIYIPKDEDFGMSPVESMAAGKPVIGVAEGGLLETVIHKKTGVLIPADPEPSDIAEAVRNLTPKRAQDMRLACEEQASQFSRERFLNNMRQAVERIKR